MPRPRPHPHSPSGCRRKAPRGSASGPVRQASSRFRRASSRPFLHPSSPPRPRQARPPCALSLSLRRRPPPFSRARVPRPCGRTSREEPSAACAAPRASRLRDAPRGCEAPWSARHARSRAKEEAARDARQGVPPCGRSRECRAPDVRRPPAARASPICSSRASRSSRAPSRAGRPARPSRRRARRRARARSRRAPGQVRCRRPPSRGRAPDGRVRARAAHRPPASSSPPSRRVRSPCAACPSLQSRRPRVRARPQTARSDNPAWRRASEVPASARAKA